METHWGVEPGVGSGDQQFGESWVVVFEVDDFDAVAEGF